MQPIGGELDSVAKCGARSARNASFTKSGTHADTPTRHQLRVWVNDWESEDIAIVGMGFIVLPVVLLLGATKLQISST